jgi:hypothetical protein
VIFYLVFDEHDSIPVLPQNFSVCIIKHVLLCCVLYFCVGKLHIGAGEMQWHWQWEGTLCCHAEPLPIGTKGYLHEHCAGTSNCASVTFVIYSNKHCVEYMYYIITVDNALQCVINCNVHWIMSVLQNLEGRD